MSKRSKQHKAEPVKNHQSSEQKNPQGQEETGNAEIGAGQRIAIDLSHRLREERKTERDEDAAKSKKQIRWTIITAGLVFVYTLIMVWQGCLTREAITNSSKQFQIDQRPYVWTNNVTPEISIQAGQRMWANLVLINYGRAPALKVRIAGKIFIGQTAKSDADKWFSDLGDKQFSDPSNSEIVVPPGIPSGAPVVSDQESPFPPKPTGKPKPQGMLFGGGGYFTVFSDNILRPDDVSYLLNTEESSVVVARIQYFDGFGRFYYSNLCMSRFVSGQTPSCEHHNEVH